MKSKKGFPLILIGLLLIAAALSLIVYNLYDEFRAERSARKAANCLEERISTISEGIPDYILNPNMEMPVENIDGIDYIGILSIPTLELRLPVISRWSYPNLKIAPCRYEGSAYLDNMIIAAHNYPSHFGTLKNLNEGDEITFTDMDGNIFRYEVAFLETLTPATIEEITDSGYSLTLFTCTVGGQNRLTVRCDRLTDE